MALASAKDIDEDMNGGMGGHQLKHDQFTGAAKNGRTWIFEGTSIYLPADSASETKLTTILRVNSVTFCVDI